MRPTDENQTGSRRPNLMSSSRRTGGEINILAMLDGQARKPGPFSRLPRVAWYGSGGLLACELAGMVAWLVHDQAGSGFEGRVLAGPPAVPLEIVAETLPNPVLHVGPPRAPGAAVVDVAADVTAPPPDAAPAALPPRAETLALDEAHQGVPALQPVAAAVVPTPVPVAAPAAVPAPHPVAAPVSAPAPRPAVHAAPRMLAKAVPPRNAEARREASTHPRRPAVVPRPKPAPAAVDTDVALISAIIQHVNQRGELKDGAAKMPNRP